MLAVSLTVGVAPRLPRPLIFRSASSSAAQHCTELVRRTDREHFLTNLLLPAAVRSDSFAIRAFSGEVAAALDSVTDRTLGAVRLQFWRDTVEGLYEDKVPNHPVAIQLHRVVKQHQPSKDLLLRLVSAREVFLTQQPFSSLEEVEEYGEAACSSVYLLLLELLGDTDGHVRQAARQLGRCEGLVTLLRAVPHHAARRRCYLPGQLLEERGLTVESVVRGGQDSQEVREVVELVAGRAQARLDSARLRQRFLTTQQKLLLLPCVSADQFLLRLSRAECNPWHQTVLRRNSWLPATLAWHKFKHKY